MPTSSPMVVHRLDNVADIVEDNGVDLLSLHQLDPTRYPYLLQSVAQTTQQVHFDILFAFPQQKLCLTSRDELIVTEANGSAESVDGRHSNFLTAFDSLWRDQSSVTKNSHGLPFSGGWFLYLGYELAGQIEPSLRLPRIGHEQLPVAFATRIPAAVIINRTTKETFVIAEREHEPAVELIKHDIDSLNKEISSQADQKFLHGFPTTIIQSIDEEPESLYLNSVRKIKQYIKDGDVFQVNLSRLWNAKLSVDVSSAQIYQRLMRTNPAPFFALAVFEQHAIISSSPERLVKVRGNQIETRPIAGTRPRGETEHHDEENLQELIGHPKERAEHIMLIDLERNDLGRVCVPGSVQVNELMALETYSHVHHIVSNVQGTLRHGCTPSEIISAVFPGGTITGCPKVRCMEIIAELEQAPRGAYTGSLGYVNHDGSMDLNILIRTLVKSEDQITLRAGAGIVADSDPHKELQETRAKAKGLLLAL